MEQFDSNEIKESIKILKSVEDEIVKGGMNAAIASYQVIYRGKIISDYANEYYHIFYALFVKIKILIDAKCLKIEVVIKIILN